MGRKSAREALFGLVYEYTVRNEEDEFTLSIMTKDLSADDIEYVESSYRGIISNREKICELIQKYSRGFALDRIYKIDLAILMVAVYEILYRDDVPYSVSANEATELAKKYSTDKSYSYVNGVLASVIKEVGNVGTFD